MAEAAQQLSKARIEEVKEYWDRRPCNLHHSAKTVGTRAYFDEVEARKYFVEPHIPRFAQFERCRGKEIIAPHVRDISDHPPDVPPIHTNACGDFFLMARSHWHALKGYPELKSHSFIDGYICFMAASLGLGQVLLQSPLRIYHQEHDRSEHTTRPLTNFHLLWESGRRMLESKTPETFNDEYWGLGHEELAEDRVSA